MIRNYFLLGLVIAGGAVSSQHSQAGPLTSAEITKIINRVAVIDPATGDHPAVVREVIKDDLGVQTGEKSRSELLFQDNTLTRIGAETFFSFKTGTRDMTLEKGSMLLQVPKGLGGAKIHTAAVTAAITGTTIMMEYIPGRYIKVLVLEGSLRLSRNGIFGNSVVLRPGKMVIMRPDAKKIPEPVDVDLKRIVQTSSLVNFPDSPALPSIGLIQDAIDVQTKSLAKNDLVPTNMVMGHGTDVMLVSNDQLARIATGTPSGTNGNTSPSTPAADVSGTGPVGALLANSSPLPITDAVTAIVDPLLLAAPVTIATAPLATVESLTGTVASLPVVTSLTNTVAALPIVGSLTGATGSAPLLDAVTGITSPIITSITGTTASLPLVNSVTSTVAALPITAAAPALTSIVTNVQTIPTNIANTLTSSTGSGTLPVNNLLSTTQTTTPTVSVSSSAQLLTMLSNTTPSTATHTAMVPASVPVSTNISPTAPVTRTVPPLPTIASTRLTSAPTALTSGTTSSQGKKTPSLPLGPRR